ncbi:MAG: NAD+ synthase, partial [Dehalococcoidia bacterium]|nr:NAD+ synthase [Dehalococcoidia bacterium]
MAQVNTTVGDFDGNTRKIVRSIDEARSLGVDVLTFPELATCGYPPEDLLLKPHFIQENLKALERIVLLSAGITVVVGFVDSEGDIYNAAAIAHDGRLIGVYRKMYLPNYGVFDENRYFRAGDECQVYVIAGVGIGINICEDIWYEAGPATAQACAGAEVILNISASPYHVGKRESRERMLATRASDSLAILAYNNLVGGQDELVFDGDSAVFDERGRLVCRGRQFEEDLIVTDLDVESVFRTRLHDPRWRKDNLLGKESDRSTKVIVSEAPLADIKPPLVDRHVEMRSTPAEIYDALVMGTRDYVRKNGIQKVVVGLSGGVDSSLVAAVAVDAL